MRTSSSFAAAFAFCTGLAGVAALGSDGVTVTIMNDTSDNIVVTIYDRGVQPAQQVVSSRVVYGNASFPLSLSADATGAGHITWTARTMDNDMRRCGHDDKPNLSDGATVNVHADGDCDS